MDLGTENSKKRDICLLRFHDGSAKLNWGGRATSLGLIRGLERNAGYRVRSVVNGDVIVKRWDRSEFYARIQRKLRRFSQVYRGDDSLVEFDEVDNEARRILKGVFPSAAVRDAIERMREVEVVVMNGEGDFILGSRITLFRSLILMRVAALLGKEVWLVNSILSYPTVGAINEKAIEAVRLVLGSCRRVVYRDPESLELHLSIFPDVAAKWCPDALFTWSKEGCIIAERREWYGPDSEGLDPEIQKLLSSKQKIVAISGSSYKLSNDERRKTGSELEDTVRYLADHGFESIIVETDKKDNGLSVEAQRMGCLSVAAGVPLQTGMRVLARADCLLSGRYHPTILAALVGTPAVVMRSNSHKTKSVQAIMDANSDEIPFFGGGLVKEAVLERVVEACGTEEESILEKCKELDKGIVF